MQEPGRRQRLGEVAVVMLKLGTIAFGGPAAHVAMLRDETVRRRQWLEDRDFLDLFGVISVLPGPSSTQLAIVLGRRRAGWAGLAVAGTCFIAPAMAIVLVLAWLYCRYGSTPGGGAVLAGVSPVVVAIVAVAVWELARKAVTKRWLAALGAAAAACTLTRISVLVTLLGAGVLAAVVENRRRITGAHAVLPMVPALSVLAAGQRAESRPGAVEVLGEFLKLGAVVFGSGYVLLAFLRADLVTGMHWLTERQLLDAVTAGQVTPGPVFTTATFVGYVVGGVPMALLATLGIFAPSFVLVAVAEPFVARIRRSPWLAPALDGVTVAAVGLMAGVTFQLGRAAVTDVFSFVLAGASLAVLVRWRPNSVWLVLAGAAAGLARQALG